MIDEKEIIKKTYSQTSDIYRIVKVLNTYCSVNTSDEGVNELIPLVKLLYQLSDEVVCNLRILQDKQNPDDEL